jgi:hypothetical protein
MPLRHPQGYFWLGQHLVLPVVSPHQAHTPLLHRPVNKVTQPHMRLKTSRTIPIRFTRELSLGTAAARIGRRRPRSERAEYHRILEQI